MPLQWDIPASKMFAFSWIKGRDFLCRVADSLSSICLTWHVTHKWSRDEWSPKQSKGLPKEGADKQEVRCYMFLRLSRDLDYWKKTRRELPAVALLQISAWFWEYERLQTGNRRTEVVQKTEKKKKKGLSFGCFLKREGRARLTLWFGMHFWYHLTFCCWAHRGKPKFGLIPENVCFTSMFS